MVTAKKRSPPLITSHLLLTPSSANSGTILSIYLFDTFFTGRYFNATADGNGTIYGLFVGSMIPMPVVIHEAVLGGATSPVFVANPVPLVVDISNTRLIGNPVMFMPPANVICTLTSRAGNPIPTVNMGACP